MPRLTVWLAVLATLAQAVLFEFAMAGREIAAGEEGAPHAHHHARLDAAKGKAPKHDPDAPRHEHGKECPFCVARATHQAPSLAPGIDVPVPPSARMRAPRRLRDRVRAQRRPARPRCRSPPARAPMPLFA